MDGGGSKAPPGGFGRRAARDAARAEFRIKIRRKGVRVFFRGVFGLCFIFFWLVMRICLLDVAVRVESGDRGRGGWAPQRERGADRAGRG